jgi:hypothetical protein
MCTKILRPFPDFAGKVRFASGEQLSSTPRFLAKSTCREQGAVDMTTVDAFSEYYTELLQGTYDCVDRIVLNAFFPFGQTGGGIRSWWRWLRGDDLTLDDEHLREMAGTFSRRLHAFCAKQGIPLVWGFRCQAQNCSFIARPTFHVMTVPLSKLRAG